MSGSYARDWHRDKARGSHQCAMKSSAATLRASSSSSLPSSTSMRYIDERHRGDTSTHHHHHRSTSSSGDGSSSRHHSSHHRLNYESSSSRRSSSSCSNSGSVANVGLSGTSSSRSQSAGDHSLKFVPSSRFEQATKAGAAISRMIESQSLPGNRVGVSLSGGHHGLSASTQANASIAQQQTPTQQRSTGPPQPSQNYRLAVTPCYPVRVPSSPARSVSVINRTPHGNNGGCASYSIRGNNDEMSQQSETRLPKSHNEQSQIASSKQSSTLAPSEPPSSLTNQLQSGSSRSDDQITKDTSTKDKQNSASNSNQNDDQIPSSNNNTVTNTNNINNICNNNKPATACGSSDVAQSSNLSYGTLMRKKHRPKRADRLSKETALIQEAELTKEVEENSSNNRVDNTQPERAKSPDEVQIIESFGPKVTFASPGTKSTITTASSKPLLSQSATFSPPTGLPVLTEPTLLTSSSSLLVKSSWTPKAPTSTQDSESSQRLTDEGPTLTPPIFLPQEAAITTNDKNSQIARESLDSGFPAVLGLRRQCDTGNVNASTSENLSSIPKQAQIPAEMKSVKSATRPPTQQVEPKSSDDSKISVASEQPQQEPDTQQNGSVLSTPKTQVAGKTKYAGIWGQTAVPPTTPFDWDTYLALTNAQCAPKEAFRQSLDLPENKFKISMRLEAKDSRNGCWCLARVVGIEGLRLRLRFDGNDAMNDMFELIDSDNIRPYGWGEGRDILLPPMGFTGNLGTYPKYVEKIMSSPDTVIASQDCFPPKPSGPGKNLFKPGMKLEAVDNKHRLLICPATIGQVDGKEVKIIFDGWRGSFDYTCRYDSRDLFPVNWCRDTNHSLQPLNGWDSLLKNPDCSSNTNKAPSQLSPEPRPTKEKSHTKPSYATASYVNKGHTRPGKYSKLPKSTKVSPLVNGPKRGSPSPQTSGKKSEAAQKKNVTKPTPEPELLRQISHCDLKRQDDQDEEDYPCNHQTDTNLPSRYQCQRTVPFCEWKKRRLEERSASVSHEASSSNGSQIEIDSCVNLNDSSANTSTTLNDDQHHQKRANSSNQLASSSASKRVCFDESVLASNRRKELMKTKPSSISCWTVKDILELISTDDTLAKYSNVLKDHEIDGKAFMLLTTEIMINHMGLKIGPVLKFNDLIEQMKRYK